MERINVSSASKYEKEIGFSRAVRIGNIIAVAGTAPIADDGSTAFPGDVYNQTRRCIEIMKKAITDAGGSMKKVIRTRVYLTNMSLWDEAGRAHGDYFSEIKPACTFVEVSSLVRNDWLVEMEADCVI